MLQRSFKTFLERKRHQLPTFRLFLISQKMIIMPYITNAGILPFDRTSQRQRHRANIPMKSLGVHNSPNKLDETAKLRSMRIITSYK